MTGPLDPDARRLADDADAQPRDGEEPLREDESRAEDAELVEPERPQFPWEREQPAAEPEPEPEPEPERPTWDPTPWNRQPEPEPERWPQPSSWQPAREPADAHVFDSTSPSAPPSQWDTERPPWAPPAEPEGPPPPPPKKGLNPLVRLGIPQPWRTIIDWIVTIAGAVAIVLAIKAWVVNPYRIPSSSMEPTLHCARPGSLCTARFSDRVLACRFCYWFSEPSRGQIIVFNVPSKAKEACGAGGVFVKRIIGLPGELWQEKEGYVYINGKRLVETYIKPERRDFQTYPARRIPPKSYFMMGDNRQSSCDSRRWGFVPRANIIGRVFSIYWPPNRIRVM